MKLSEDTLVALQCAAKINPHLVVEPGNEIRSITPLKNRMFSASLQDTFPIDFALHDLNGFLKQLSLFDEPELEFKESFMVIRDQFGSMSKYWYSSKEDLVYIDRPITLNEFEFEFKLPDIALDKIIRASAANQVDDILFCCEGGKIYIKSLNKDNPKRVFSVELGEGDADFKFYIKHAKKNKLTLLPLSYNVQISGNGIFCLTCLVNGNTFKYYVASERE